MFVNINWYYFLDVNSEYVIPNEMNINAEIILLKYTDWCEKKKIRFIGIKWARKQGFMLDVEIMQQGGVVPF
jgi:hypothetical protein